MSSRISALIEPHMLVWARERGGMVLTKAAEKLHVETQQLASWESGEFAEACKNSVSDDSLQGIPLVGSIDQLTHADDLLVNFTSWPRRLECLYSNK